MSWLDIFTRCCGCTGYLYIALVVALVNSTIGIIYGGISGYLGGPVDMVMMHLRVHWCHHRCSGYSPHLVLRLVLASDHRHFGHRWLGWPGSLGTGVPDQEMEFVMASRTMGAGNLWVIFKHLVPNAISPILTNMAFVIPRAIFTEAFLSYIGLGLPLPMASWGVLASDGANKILIYPYQLFFPALLISLTMLCFNVIGDGLRDALDPKMRNL